MLETSEEASGASEQLLGLLELASGSYVATAAADEVLCLVYETQALLEVVDDGDVAVAVGAVDKG